jgi:uncharacterized protein YjbK
MTKNVEIENKYLVAKLDFYRLLKHFNKTSKDLTKQTNYYFDTKELSLFKKHNGALRVRRIKDHYELTTKQKVGNKSLENTINIKGDDLKKLIKNNFNIKGIQKILVNFKIDPTTLVLLAKLDTYRLKLPYLGGYLFLDKNHYGITYDYEVEFESKNYESGHQKMLALFKELQIIDFKVSKPKVRRALNL